MPINPNALGAPATDSDGQPGEASQLHLPMGGDGQDHPTPAEPAKRSRRSKAQMIADAVVPADDAPVALKDVSTGAKIERPWLVALEMVRDGKAEFADKAMKYAMQKYDQQKAAPAFDQSSAPGDGEVGESRIDPDDGNGYVLKQVVRHDGDTSTTGARTEVVITDVLGGHQRVIPAATWSTWSATPKDHDASFLESASPDVVPPEAAVGDEVVVGSTVFRVGHGRVLVEGIIVESGDSSKILHAARRWQRELGAGVDGPWQSTTLRQSEPVKPTAVGNGHSDHVPAPVALPEGVEIEQVGLRGWRVGTGVLEKIGLPDYSSLQIGPITASREVLDDGRRTTVTVGDREAVIPTACIEIAHQAMDIVEYIARYQRGELVSFMESTGALKQPVS